MFREHGHNTKPDRASSGSVLPKVLAAVAVVALLRMLVSHKHGGGTSRWRDRRREMIAEIHRELHQEAGAEASTAKA